MWGFFSMLAAFLIATLPIPVYHLPAWWYPILYGGVMIGIIGNALARRF